MNYPSEIERVDQYTSGEVPPRIGLRFVGNCQKSAHTTLGRIRSVMKIVAIRRSSTWPDDAWWKAHLPDWFATNTKWRPLEVPLSVKDSWDFGSWLDAMKMTGWEWWSGVACENRVQVNLCAFEWPYSVDPMEHLIWMSGASDISFEEL